VQVLCNKYGVIPIFFHVDKDMAEIGMIRSVWNAKIQVCLWHLKCAVRARLEKRKVSTTPYNVHRAHADYAFIDVNFKPAGRADPTEYEGRVLDAPAFPVNPTPALRPHTVTIKLPPTQQRSTILTDATNLPACKPGNNTPNAIDAEDDEKDGKRTFCPIEFREPIITAMERHLTANCSTEGADRKSAVLGCFQRIPGISVSSTPIPLKPR
jgi:hypothetical protein